MNNSDKDLLDRYLNHTATEAEEKEFESRFDEGEFDHLIDNEVLQMISEREKVVPSSQQQTWLREVHARMLTRNNIGTPVVPIQRKSKTFLWAAAAAVILLTTATGLWMNSHDYFKSGSEQVAEVEPSSFSGKQLVRLPDGSTALLNENSKLSFTQAFGKSKREVTLEGEALFDVTHDPAKAFIVHTGKVSTTVLGTSFNVNTTQTKITVTVVRGLVQVGDELRIYGKINPDEQIEVDIASSDFVVRNGKAEEALAWQKNFVTLDNITMTEAAAKIEKRFNVKVTIANEELKDCVVSAIFFDNETLKQMVEGISAVRQATATINGNTVVIKGGIGCKSSQ